MPAFTSFLNLYKPGGGSSGTITPDEVVDIDRLNANFDLIDGFASSVDGWQTARGDLAERNQQFTGLAANRAAVTGMKLGDTYQETNGSKLVWKYDGTGWIITSSSLTSYNSTTVSFTGTPVMKSGVSSGTTSAGGVLSHTFPSAFPTACVGVVTMPHQSSGYSGDAHPVLVQGSVSKSGFQTFWGGVSSGSATVPYIAFGY